MSPQMSPATETVPAMPNAKLGTKGQIVIPKGVREYLEVKPGDRVEFSIRDGEVLVRPALVDIRDLKGLLRRAGGRPAPVAEMKAAVRQRVAGATQYDDHR